MNAPALAPDAQPAVEARRLTAGYGGANVLHNVDLRVMPGEVVVVLGANGAGKTTLMRAIANLIPHSGELLVDGQTIGRSRPDEMLRRGVGLVPQGRGTLTTMSVRDNLRVGAVTRTDADGIRADIDRWCAVFPPIAARLNQTAGTMSGGEQQMLAVARAMMARPKVLMCDEISLGLAPLVVRQLFDVLRDLNRDDGVSLLLVEQNADLALEIAAQVYLLEVGEVVDSGPVERFRDSDAIRKAYLGY